MDKIKRKIYLDKIIEVMKNDFPLLKNMELYGFYEQLSRDELNYVFSEIFEQPVKKYINNIINENGNVIYRESNGYWEKYKYDEYGNKIYSVNSNGDWKKWEYDENGNMLYYEDSDGEIMDISSFKKILQNK